MNVSIQAWNTNHTLINEYRIVMTGLDINVMIIKLLMLLNLYDNYHSLFWIEAMKYGIHGSFNGPRIWVTKGLPSIQYAVIWAIVIS